MKRLSKNFAAVMLSDVARRLLGFFAVAYLARTVGAAAFGIINVGFTVLAYALLMSSAGLNAYGIREIAKGGDHTLVNKISSMRLLLAAFVYVLISVTGVIVIQDSATVKVVVVCSLSVFMNALLLDWYFQGKEEMTVVGISRGISAGVYLLILLGFVHSEHSILWVAIGAVVGDAVAAIFLLIVYRKRHGSLRLRFEPASWKPLAANSLQLSGGNILANLSVNLPVLVLGILMTNVQVGVYSAASKLVVFLLTLDRVLAALLLPAASRLHVESPEKLANRLDVALKWIIVAGLPLAIGGTLLSDKIILFVYGNSYGDATMVFRVLLWFFFFTMLHTVFTSGLLAMSREKLYLKTMVLSALCYGSSIIFCTKVFGVTGTAAAMAGSEAVTLVLMRRQFRKFVNVQEGHYIIKTIPAAMIMGCVVWYISSLPLFVSIFIGGMVYIAAIAATGAVTRTDVKELLERV